MIIPATNIKIDTPPPWLPEGLRGRTVAHRFQFSRGERQIFRKRKRIAPSLWAEKHRVITMGPLKGPWRNEVTPYLSGIMDASFHDAVQTVIICKSPQTGGSEAINNCAGYVVDRSPGPLLYVFPDETTAKENAQDRIIPMIESSPRLRSYFTGYEDDKASRRIKLKHMPIYLAWATSAARLANKPIRYLIMDELDKYPPTAGKKESSPEALAEARTVTYRWDKKIWKISTPTIESGPIWQALTVEAQVIFDYWVVCPLCGERQLMRFSRETFRWPEDERDPERIEALDLAWYECEHCHGHWNDTLRDRAVKAGRWYSRISQEQIEAGEEPVELFDCLDTSRPKKIGFHIQSWISYFVPLSEVAAAFLKGQQSLQAFKNFKNKYEALPWKQVVVTSGEAEILKARCALPPQVVPAEAIALTCGIDVQKYGFWFCVRAWASDYTRWLIHYGNLVKWEDVEKLLFETAYPVQDSEKKMRIFRACIDTGGGGKYDNMSMTEETYWWLRDNASGRGCRCWGTKGSSKPLAGKLMVGKPLDKTPSGKPLSGGLQIISVDTEKIKDAYHYHLLRAIEDLPQGGYLHSETGKDYADQILAEEKQITDRGIEEWVQVFGRPNHLFDADCLAMLAADPEFPGGGIHILAAEIQRRKSGSNKRRVISKGIES